MQNIYYNKYLKYKQKYIDLKKEMMGGNTVSAVTDNQINKQANINETKTSEQLKIIMDNIQKETKNEQELITNISTNINNIITNIKELQERNDNNSNIDIDVYNLKIICNKLSENIRIKKAYFTLQILNKINTYNLNIFWDNLIMSDPKILEYLLTSKFNDEILVIILNSLTDKLNDENSKNLLILALKRTNINSDIIKILTKKNATILGNDNDDDKNNILHLAIKLKNKEIIILIINHIQLYYKKHILDLKENLIGIIQKINKRDIKQEQKEESVKINKTAIVDKIIKLRTFILISQNKEGNTPLHLSILSNETDIIDIIFNNIVFYIKQFIEDKKQFMQIMQIHNLNPNYLNLILTKQNTDNNSILHLGFITNNLKFLLTKIIELFKPLEFSQFPENNTEVKKKQTMLLQSMFNYKEGVDSTGKTTEQIEQTRNEQIHNEQIITNLLKLTNNDGNTILHLVCLSANNFIIENPINLTNINIIKSIIKSIIDNLMYLFSFIILYVHYNNSNDKYKLKEIFRLKNNSNMMAYDYISYRIQLIEQIEKSPYYNGEHKLWQHFINKI